MLSARTTLSSLSSKGPSCSVWAARKQVSSQPAGLWGPLTCPCFWPLGLSIPGPVVTLLLAEKLALSSAGFEVDILFLLFWGHAELRWDSGPNTAPQGCYRLAQPGLFC